jgi:hypothetical protein
VASVNSPHWAIAMDCRTKYQGGYDCVEIVTLLSQDFVTILSQFRWVKA